MTSIRSRIIMVGVFPPPVHGMAVVNAAVRDALRQVGVVPQVVDLAAPSLDRSLTVRLSRFPRFLRGLVRLAGRRGLRGGMLYMSVSGGLGQLYEIAFIALARLRGMKLCLHHHSFAYLDAPSRLTRVLAEAAGASAVHVTQSLRMADRLRAVYEVERVVAVSNAVFLLSGEGLTAKPRRRLRTLGFISNIAAEKGVFEFLDLMAAVQDAGLPVRAKLAGPFQDAETERQVRAQLAALPAVEYVGPKYGAEKDTFFAGIDAFVFPTRYANETDPIANHEAMSRAIPVIAYGRGVIPEIVGPDCGRVIDPLQPFVAAALAQIEDWLADPAAFAAASGAAARRFTETYAQSEWRWQALLSRLTGGDDAKFSSICIEDSSSQT
jgi:glycosyltransferase involved in cell wall biosynthesis